MMEFKGHPPTRLNSNENILLVGRGRAEYLIRYDNIAKLLRSVSFLTDLWTEGSLLQKNLST